jgi:hypothetical protein
MPKTSLCTVLLATLPGWFAHVGRGGEMPGPAVEPKAALPVEAPSPRRAAWTISAGPVLRSYSGIRLTPGLNSSPYRVPLLTGSGRNGRSQAYHDGFVRPDAGTPTDGKTWNWGYDHESQVEGGRLALHASGSRSEVSSVVRDFERRAADLEEEAPGFRLALSAALPLAPQVDAGWEGSFSFVSFDSGAAGQGWEVVQRRRDSRLQFTDFYDTGGIILPEAPYQGSPEGPGPVIGALPSSRAVRAIPNGGASAHLQSRWREELEVEHMALSTGPSITWHSGQFSLGASAGVALNVVNWDLHSMETVEARAGQNRRTLARWDHSDSGTELTAGAWIQAGGALKLGQRWQWEAAARYDWSETVTGNAGKSRFDLGLDTWTFYTGFGFKF